MPLTTAWLRYLWKERKAVLLQQVLRMLKFHQTSFATLLHNVLEEAEKHDAGFTFPVVAFPALRNPEHIGLIRSYHQEIASHGYKHINYRYLSIKAQRADIVGSLRVFKSLGVPIRGFRAPYNMYGKKTPELLNGFGFLWDGGQGFRKQYWQRTSFFRVPLNGHESNYLVVPLCRWADDVMMDIYGLEIKQITKLLKIVIQQTCKNHGVVMFDLHPIRIGQPKYINLLGQILKEGAKLNGWFPTVTEGIDHWIKREEWRDGASFCCLLTGDIDNFTFIEYLTRLF